MIKYIKRRKIGMGDVKISNTPYDDVFRTLLNDCSSLIIPVINEIFGENYSGKEKIIFSSNEHFLNKQGGNAFGAGNNQRIYKMHYYRYVEQSIGAYSTKV